MTAETSGTTAFTCGRMSRTSQIAASIFGRCRKPPSLLFVGGFRHRPNIDAAIWLVRDILPQVKAVVPEVSAVIAGTTPPAAVKGLAGPDVLVTDYVSDPMLERLYRTATVAVAPLRFGAGVKGKVVEAMRFGVP